MNLPGRCEIEHDRSDFTLTITFSEERLVFVRGREWIGSEGWTCSGLKRDEPLVDRDLGDLTDLLDYRDLREIRDLTDEMDLAERESDGDRSWWTKRLTWRSDRYRREDYGDDE